MSNETSSKFEKLIANLGEKLELTGREIADILWLTQQHQTTIEENPDKNSTNVKVVEGGEDKEPEEPQIPQEPEENVGKKPDNTTQLPKNNIPETQSLPVDTPQPAESKAGVFAESSRSTSGETVDIKLPDAPGLREPLKLARAIRPLIQKIDSQTELILDEEATANRIAKDGIRIPVFQPAKEPAFDLMLVVDESSTMVFWRKAIQELQQLFQVLGAFRDIQVWGLVTNKENIYLRRGMGKKARKHRHYHPRFLVDPSGKRLILVASDCVSDIWHNGKAFEMLNIWTQKNSVAIIQMLPQWLWQRTGLSLGAKVQFSSLTPRIPNQDLLIKKILLWDDIDFATGTKIPIFTLEEESARTWSKMIGGRSDAHVTGFVFPSNSEPEEDYLIEETQEIDTEEITSNFRRTASPIARKLASLLSAAPIINLPVVRIIQEEMLEQSQQVHVAEVFLGGIIKRKQEIEITSETNPDDIEFDFINEDIRKSFLDAAPVTDSLDIIEVISKYFANKLNKTLSEFNALLRKPQLVDDENKDEIKPFALLSAKVLKRLGGDYVRFAEEMEQSWDNFTFKDEENHPSLRTGNVYALLVGIDEYHPQSGVTSLQGCVNDIEAIEKYLHNQVNTENSWELVTQKLTNELATRQAVIDGFEQHLSQATREDVVFFYYAGHGSYEIAPEVFREQELDGKIETLVCYDSRTSGGTDLADKELNYLIEQVARKNPHILIILDSSHSGTATRDQDVVERRTSPNGTVRDLKDFIFDQEWVNRRLSKDYQRPRHVLISACRHDSQTAKEYTGSDGKRRGAFSYFLTEALARNNGSLSYANLVQDINGLITRKFKDQSPQIEAASDDLLKTFLTFATKRVYYFTLFYDNQKNNSWLINGGILHGIRPISEGETSLAIFPQGSTQEELQNIDNAISKAKLTKVFTEVSVAEIIEGTSILSEDKPFWAVVTDVPLPKLKVSFQGEAAGVELARTELAKVNSGQPSLFVRETESLTDADYYLEAVEGQFWIKQPSDKKPLVAPVPELPQSQGYTAKDAETIIKRLEHIARWKNILELKTPPTSQIKAGDVEMEVIVTSGDNQYSSKTEKTAMRGEYTWKDNNFDPPRVEIKVTNKSEKELYFQVIGLAESFAIDVPNFFEERSSILLPKKSIQSESFNGKRKKLTINRKYLENGITEYDTILKLIVSTREFNASLLEQPGLDSPPPAKRSTDLSGTLNRLMNKVYTREFEDDDDEYIDNWMTQEVKIHLVKPPGGVEIEQSESTDLLPGVELQSHPSLKGKFSINPLPPSSRHINSDLVPPIFVQEQTVVERGGKRLSEPYNFNMARGGGGNLSLLEIVDVQNHESVTPENPIKLLVSNTLSSDEYILPVAYNGEFFLPLGKAKSVNGKTEITLERLPEPTVDSRSLQGSIKILFQKVFYESAGKQLGMNFKYPLLRIANVSESGRVTYNPKPEEIKAKVASANKILLYIHGIIGDTESILPSLKANTTKNQDRIQDKYDLVLAFDYENINTTIQENAKLLKQRLEEIGISANHGKQLDIVAHSMGGLVSRTFIEVEGGNQIVQHLVMLGTPNAGSPWPKIQDWAFTALGIGLNQLSSVAWGTNVIAGLLAFLEANDKASEQMKYQSDFIQSIAKNPDPNVQYTIIAGDRTIRPEALEVAAANSSQIQRLMRKLFGSTVDKVVDKVFFEQPNDIAVTTASIKSVSLQRNPQPRILSPDVACDHLTYFTSEAGLDALVQALSNDL